MMREAGRRRTAIALVLLAGLGTGAARVSAQTTYVCQTPTFWCAFPWTPGIPNGTICHCNTWQGPVNGYSIDPSQQAIMPPQPTATPVPPPASPQQMPSPAATPPAKAAPVNDPDECFRGLGNCQGTFSR